MSTKRVLVVAMLFIGLSAQSQKFYIRTGFGLSVSTSGQYIQNGNSSSATGIDVYTSKKQGYGTGLPFAIAAGYSLTHNFSVELGVDYFYGLPISQTFNSETSDYDAKLRGQMLSLVPAIAMSLPLGKFIPYARLGVKVGVLNSVSSRIHIVSSIGVDPSDVQSEKKDYGGIALGVQAAAGTEIILNGLISLFGEIQVDGISFAPKHGKYTKYAINGIDQMGSRSIKENRWNFVSKVQYPNTIPGDQPNEYGKVNYQFGNVGLVVGVRFKI